MLKILTINGARLHVEDQGEGPAILTLHGGLGLGSRQGDVAAFGVLASEGYRVVSYDQRGNGDSEAVAPYSHEQFIADTEELRQQLDLGKIILCGSSYGGFLALEYALKYPQNLAGIVLRDTAASNAYNDTAKKLALKSGLPGVDAEMLDRLFAGKTRSNEDFLQMYKAIQSLYFVTSDPEILEARLKGVKVHHETHNWAYANNIPTFNLVDRLKTIQVPMLVLCGRHDWITPLAASEEIAREVPNSRLVVFEHSGHSPQREEPEKFYREVRQFLAKAFSKAELK